VQIDLTQSIRSEILSRRLQSLVQKVAMRWPSGVSTAGVSVLDPADELVEVQAAQVVSHLAAP
jgi:hypothetical protein